MGPSGSGKTTLLNCVSTIDRPTAGSHPGGRPGRHPALPGRSWPRFRRERLGFIFQDCNLLDTLTACENIALALTIITWPRRGRSTPGWRTMAARAAALRTCLDKYPYQMSGGQQQRVRLRPGPSSPGPALVLADEPTGALDSQLRPRCCWSAWSQLNQSRGPPSSWSPTTPSPPATATGSLFLQGRPASSPSCAAGAATARALLRPDHRTS